MGVNAKFLVFAKCYNITVYLNSEKNLSSGQIREVPLTLVLELKIQPAMN
jgi:hypothetical protein